MQIDFYSYHAKKGAWGENQTRVVCQKFCEAMQSQKGFLVRNELKTHLLTDDFNPIKSKSMIGRKGRMILCISVKICVYETIEDNYHRI